MTDKAGAALSLSATPKTSGKGKEEKEVMAETQPLRDPSKAPLQQEQIQHGEAPPPYQQQGDLGSDFVQGGSGRLGK